MKKFILSILLTSGLALQANKGQEEQQIDTTQQNAPTQMTTFVDSEEELNQQAIAKLLEADMIENEALNQRATAQIFDEECQEKDMRIQDHPNMVDQSNLSQYSAVETVQTDLSTKTQALPNEALTYATMIVSDIIDTLFNSSQDHMGVCLLDRKGGGNTEIITPSVQKPDYLASSIVAGELDQPSVSLGQSFGVEGDATKQIKICTPNENGNHFSILHNGGSNQKKQETLTVGATPKEVHKPLETVSKIFFRHLSNSLKNSFKKNTHQARQDVTRNTGRYVNQGFQGNSVVMSSRARSQSDGALLGHAELGRQQKNSNERLINARRNPYQGGEKNNHEH